MNQRIKWLAAAATDAGRVRRNNEDRYFLNTQYGIYLVADGVSSTRAGDKAAETAGEVIPKRLARHDGTPAERMREAIALANNEIHALATFDPKLTGMACVATVLLIEDGQAIAGQVGDSRLYRIRDGAIEHMTPDHSPVGELVRRGELTEEQAMRHPDRSQVYRDIGTEHRDKDSEGFIDVVTFDAAPRDAFVLVSDGVCDMIPSKQILRIAEANCGDPAAVVKALIDAANEAGGKDNATAVYVEGPEFARDVKARAAEPPATQPVATGRYKSALWTVGAAAGLAVAYWLGSVGAQAAPPTRPPIEIAVGAGRTYAHLDTAVEAAQPGDHLLLDSGDYTIDGLTLRKPLTIEAREPRKAVLQINGTTGISIQAEGIRLTGLVIRPAPKADLETGVSIEQGSAQIELSEISGATHAAVTIEGKAIAVLRANHFHDNPGPAIEASPESQARLWHNIIRGEPGSALRAGIEWRGNTLVHENPKAPKIPPDLLSENLLTSVTRTRR